MIDISKRLTLLIIFLALAILKYAGLNSLIDDALLLVIGASIGKEVIQDAKKKEGQT